LTIAPRSTRSITTAGKRRVPQARPGRTGPLDGAIHLDIRYATNNDFLGTAVYTQARAFLQRPAAEALLRAHQKLRKLGYGCSFTMLTGRGT